MRILKPRGDGHPGCSFRELLDLWAEAGYCELEDHDGLGVWIDDKERKILLYDYTILLQSQSLSWDIGLFANTVHKGENSYPWIFWPKHSREMCKSIKNGIPKYRDRNATSIWIGTKTTGKRIASTAWEDCIDLYWMGPHLKQLLPPADYLSILKRVKFGLCIAGVGPKCLRDVELMGNGTVPVFTPGVSTDYYNKLIKDKHYLYAENPEQFKEVTRSCSREKWEYMSNECQIWFNENCSVAGSFATTNMIIERALNMEFEPRSVKEKYLTKPASVTAEELMKRLLNMERTYLIRMGDSELRMLEDPNHQSKTQMNSPGLTKELREVVAIKEKDFIVAPGVGLDNREFDDKLRHNPTLDAMGRGVLPRHCDIRLFENCHALTCKFLWEPEWFMRYCDELRKHKPLFVAGRSLCDSELLREIFGVSQCIRFPDKMGYAKIEQKMPKIRGAAKSHKVIIEVIGSSGKAVGKRLWNEGWDGYYLDLGAIANALLGQEVRGWMRTMVTPELLEKYKVYAKS